jgi:hypothetical protein
VIAATRPGVVELAWLVDIDVQAQSGRLREPKQEEAEERSGGTPTDYGDPVTAVQGQAGTGGCRALKRA